MAPLMSSLEIFEEAGMEALRKKSIALTAYLETLLDRLDPSFCQIITPREPAARGCQLSLSLPKRAREAQRALEAAGVVVDFREPDILRVAPVPLYNRFHDVWRFVRILGEIASSRPFRD
jgi:kynureninase